MTGVLAAAANFGAATGGGGGSLDTQTVTAGLFGTIPDRDRGFIAGSLGSCADATSNLYSGAAITELYHNETNSWVLFKVTGIVANSGWTDMVVNGTTFVRASASFSASGGSSQWVWSGASNPFGGAGTVRTVAFN